jgi:hypothetical protein
VERGFLDACPVHGIFAGGTVESMKVNWPSTPQRAVQLINKELR